MSVPKYKRKESKLQVFVNATRLRRTITQWCLRDFGIKSRVRKISNLFSAVKFLPEDAELVEELFNKYPEMNDGRVLEDFPAWIVQKCKFSLIDEVNSLCRNLTHANSIYPQCEKELTQRRLYINVAIGCCENLISQIEFISDVFPVNLNSLQLLCEELKHEEALLKSLRKTDARRYNERQGAV